MKTQSTGNTRCWIESREVKLGDPVILLHDQAESPLNVGITVDILFPYGEDGETYLETWVDVWWPKYERTDVHLMSTLRSIQLLPDMQP